MNKYKFTKMQGAGNDFIVFDAKLNENLILSSEKIRKICNRNFGVGADGVLVFSDSNDADFMIEHYESDGSTGNLCANGSRCVIKYAFETGRLKDSHARFIFNGKEYSGEIMSEELIKFNLNPPVQMKLNFKIKGGGQLINASYVDNGTPHIVIKVQDVLADPKDMKSNYTDINEFPIQKLGMELRHSPDFAPKGTNINFYSIEKDMIHIRSFERGIEGETLACGTGIAATALITNVNDKIEPPVKFMTRGGEALSVNFSVANQMVKDLSLVGKAEVIFNGELLI